MGGLAGEGVPREAVLAVVLPGEKALPQRAPGADRQVVVAGHLQVVPLDLAVDEVVPGLEDPERFPAVLAGDVVGADHLPGVRPQGRGPEVVDLPRLDEPVQGLHEFFGGGGVVPAVDVEDVDVVRPEAVEEFVDAMPDVLAVGAAAVGIAVADLPVDLRGDRVSLAVPAREPVADPGLGLPAAVDVRGVDVAAASGLVGVEEVVGPLLVDLHVPRGGFAAEPPGAELEFARRDAGRPQGAVVEIDLRERCHTRVCGRAPLRTVPR